MPSVNLSPLAGAGAQFFDNNGNPLSGGKLWSFLAGTTTEAETYRDSSGDEFHPNPIILNAAGRIPDGGEIWLDSEKSYKFVLTDSLDVEISTWDNISGIVDTATIDDGPFLRTDGGNYMTARLRAAQGSPGEDAGVVFREAISTGMFFSDGRLSLSSDGDAMVEVQNTPAIIRNNGKTLARVGKANGGYAFQGQEEQGLFFEEPALLLSNQAAAGTVATDTKLTIPQGNLDTSGYSFTESPNSGMTKEGDDIVFYIDGVEVFRISKNPVALPTWQSVSRNLNTTYTNDSTGYLYVQINVSAPNVDWVSVRGFVNDMIMSNYQNIGRNYTIASTTLLIVPPGQTYRVDTLGNAGPRSAAWRELLLPR